MHYMIYIITIITLSSQPFTLDNSRRAWVFGGELENWEGRRLEQVWAMLFSDLLLFTVINRDRVIYVVEEPVPLRAVRHAIFNIKKKRKFTILLDLS